MEGFEVTYLNEKLNCIFDGRIIAVDQIGLGAGYDKNPCS